jgi:type IV secretion system protein VirB1
MDPATFAALAAVCAPLVHADTARALVMAESSMNPHAIGVVGGVLERQPRALGEAVATANALRDGGWNFSVGLAQINVRNFERLGLTAPAAFDPCANMRAMQTILGECMAGTAPGTPAQTALREALSCYYSGNFVTGLRDGYVHRVAREAYPFVNHASPATDRKELP